MGKKNKNSTSVLNRSSLGFTSAGRGGWEMMHSSKGKGQKGKKLSALSVRVSLSGKTEQNATRQPLEWGPGGRIRKPRG